MPADPVAIGPRTGMATLRVPGDLEVAQGGTGRMRIAFGTARAWIDVSAVVVAF